MAMKLIGAGLMRTATTTQMVALEMLGFGPCYHMRNVLMNLETELPHWEAAQDGNPDWDAVFGDAQSTVERMKLTSPPTPAKSCLNSA